MSAIHSCAGGPERARKHQKPSQTIVCDWSLLTPALYYEGALIISANSPIIGTNGANFFLKFASARLAFPSGRNKLIRIRTLSWCTNGCSIPSGIVIHSQIQVALQPGNTLQCASAPAKMANYGILPYLSTCVAFRARKGD